MNYFENIRDTVLGGKKAGKLPSQVAPFIPSLPVDRESEPPYIPRKEANHNSLGAKLLNQNKGK